MTVESPPRVGAPAPPEARARSGRPSAVTLLERYVLLLCLAGFVVFFSLFSKTSDVFLTTANLQAVLGNQSVVAIVALAALIPLVCGQFDLSVGATAGLAAIFTADAMSSGLSPVLAVVLGVAIGLSVGLVNALLVCLVRVDAVIATLGTSTIIAGAIAQKTGGIAIAGSIPASVFDFGAGTTLGIPNPTYVLAGVALLLLYLMGYTPFGRFVYALGSNAEAARLVGLRTNRLLGSTFVVAGALAGAAGVLQVARAGGADPGLGNSFTLPALAAAFLSAASIKPGRYNVGGTLVAIFFLATLNSGLNLAGAPDYVDRYVNGAALIVGVALAVTLGRRRRAGAA